MKWVEVPGDTLVPASGEGQTQDETFSTAGRTERFVPMASRTPVTGHRGPSTRGSALRADVNPIF